MKKENDDWPSYTSYVKYMGVIAGCVFRGYASIEF